MALIVAHETPPRILITFLSNTPEAGGSHTAGGVDVGLVAVYDDADKENQKNQKNQRYLEIAAKISQVREFARVCQGEAKSGSCLKAV
jgi:hypothetical protein